MTTTTAPKKAAEKLPQTPRKVAAPPKKLPARPVKAGAKPTSTLTGNLRNRLVLTQAEFARLLPVSIRSLATLEGGTPPTEPVARRLTELGRLTTALSEVIKKESLGKWLQTPNPAFDGSKPLEVIERGESDRLWEMIYFLRSGVAS